jgi:hypothetical protein
MDGPKECARKSLVLVASLSTPWSASVSLSAQGTTAESMSNSALFAVGWSSPSPEATATQRRAVAGDRHRVSTPRHLPLGPQKSPPLPVSDLRGTPCPHTDEVLSPRHQNPSLVGPHEKPGTAPPPRRLFVPYCCLPHLPGQTL